MGTVISPVVANSGDGKCAMIGVDEANEISFD